MKLTIAILSTSLTIWTLLTIIAILTIKSLIKKGIIKIKFDSEKKADILINELDNMLKEEMNK
jgi:hypothetical protein